MTFIIISFFSYLAIGVVAGIMGALLGIGGGALTVPSLLLVFSLLKFPKDSIMHIAIGTSLSSMVINSLAATYFHNRKKNVVWKAIGRIFLGIVVGSFTGAFIAKVLSTDSLKNIFGVFACLIGLFFIKPIKDIPETNKIPSLIIFTLVGFSVACLANILGLGGGFFMLPILFYFNFHGRKAIGTSSATSFLISFCGTIGYLLVSKNDLNIPWCYGYIYVPAFVIIGISSLASSFYGVRLAHFLPIKTIRRIFAGVIISVGLLMIFS